MIDWLWGGLISLLGKRLLSLLGGLASSKAAALFTSPDVTALPQTRLLSDRTSTVVDAAFVLAIIAAGAVGMTHGNLQVRYQVKDLLPRLVFGFVIAHFGDQMCSMLIEAANALCQALVREPESMPHVLGFAKQRVQGALTNPANALVAVAIAVTIIVLAYLLMVGWAIRVVVLVLLAGLAPAALACYCLPQTQPVAQLWWRSLLGCLAIPVLQALALSTGVILLLNPDHNGPVGLGAVPGDADLFNLIIAAAVLWMTVRVPKLVSRYIGHGGRQMSTAGVVLRAVLIQTITSRIRAPFRGKGK